MLLSEAETLLMDSILHAGTTTFGTDKQHRAIRRAGHKFNRVTKWDRAIAKVSVATAVAQIGTVTVTAVDATPADNTFTLTVRDHAGNSATASAAGDTDVTTTAAALVTAWNASTSALLTPVTASSAVGVVTLTADTAGVPFYVASSVSGTGSGTIGAYTETTANVTGGEVDIRDTSAYTAASASIKMTFADGGADPDTITRSSGSWIADGFRPGMVLTVASATETADNGTYTVAVVTDTVITVLLEDTLTASVDETTPTVTGGLTDFEPYRLLRSPYIDDVTNARIRYVQAVSWENLRQLIDQGYDTEGIPEFIAFTGRQKAYLYPRPDTGYTLCLPYWRPLITWTPGTTNTITLNLPDDYADDVIGFGAKSFLIGGAPGHPDARDAEIKFDALLADAVGALQPPEVFYQSQGDQNGRSYPMAGYIP